MRPQLVAASLILFVIGSCALPAIARARAATVIWLSWDGVRHDLPDRGSVPGLERMQREGVRAPRLIPIDPTTTFPNHVAQATCARASRHGIVANSFWDRERGDFSYANDASWIQAEPLWVAAERQGVKSAVYYWVGSETDWQGVGASHRVVPFDSGVPESEKVDRILAWLDLPPADRPQLILSWWHGADRVGHRKGPDHPDVVTALEQQDRELRRLLAAIDDRSLWGDTTLIVSSDHGMAEVSQEIDLASTLRAAGVEARVRAGAALANVYLDDPSSLARARAALRAIPDVKVFEADEIPERLHISHPTRSGDLVVTTSPPAFFGRARGAEGWFLRGLRQLGFGVGSGSHGYSRALPEMAGIFYALGRGARAGDLIEAPEAIDIAPTVAALLGISPPRSCEGSRIEALGPSR